VCAIERLRARRLVICVRRTRTPCSFPHNRSCGGRQPEFSHPCASERVSLFGLAQHHFRFGREADAVFFHKLIPYRMGDTVRRGATAEKPQPLNSLAGRYASAVCDTWRRTRDRMSAKDIVPVRNKYKCIASNNSSVVLRPDACCKATSE
jgi:hypothetical protein